jgi:glycerate dehydrogenase
MKIVFLDAYTLHPKQLDLSIFESLGEFITYDRTRPEELYERAKDADIILTNKTVLNNATIDILPNLKYIGVTATGYNIVDIEAARNKGIVVTNARNYSSNSVAQQVFAMMLAFANRLSEHSDFNRWASQPDFCYYENNLTELSGKTIGLIGFGNIAQKVAQIALVFDMKVLVNKVRPLLEPIKGIEIVDLDTVLRKSDYLSLHCPLTAKNEKFMNAETFSKMKPSAILINTARGGLINESDLKGALETDKIGGAYLDVLAAEPPKENHILRGVKNLKTSPHIAWASFEARQKLVEIVFYNLKAFLEGRSENVL